MLKLIDKNRSGTGDDEAGVTGRCRSRVRAVKVEDGTVELGCERSEQSALAHCARPDFWETLQHFTGKLYSRELGNNAATSWAARRTSVVDPASQAPHTAFGTRLLGGSWADIQPTFE
jgi:hypothetical protein